VTQPIPLDEAINALKRDPTLPVRIRVDDELTIEVRAVEPSQPPKRSAADAFREVGRWEGESGEALDALCGRSPALESTGDRDARHHPLCIFDEKALGRWREVEVPRKVVERAQGKSEVQIAGGRNTTFLPVKLPRNSRAGCRSRGLPR